MARTDFTVEDVHAHDGAVVEMLDRLFDDLAPHLRTLAMESLLVGYIRRSALTVEKTAAMLEVMLPRVGQRLQAGENGTYAHILVPATANDIEPGDALSDPALEASPRTVGDNPWHCGPAKHTTEDGTEYPHVTTTQGMRGHFAVLLWWNPDMGGFPEPWQSGDGSYKTSAEAAVEGKAWAEAEEIPFYG